VKYRIIAAISFAVLASGCTRKAEGQTVAVVNGDEITVPDLNFALSLAKIPEGTDKNAARTQILQQLVDRRLLAQQAHKEGIDKTPEYLNRERRADEDLLISMLANKRFNTAQLPSDREIQNYIATHPETFASRETWSLDQVIYQTPSDNAVKAEIQNAKNVGQLIAVLQKHGIAYQQQKNRLDTAVVPPELYSKLVGLAGEPFAIPIGQRTIASAISGREPHPITGDQAKPVAVDAMRKSQTTKALEGLLKSLRGSAKIDYQSGYSPPAAAQKK
jgi:peptidyl-prolyl cis-trans isomerase C